MSWLHPKIILFWIAAILLLVPGAAFALDSVTIVMSEEGGAYTEFANALTSNLNQKNKKFSIKLLPLANLKNDDLRAGTTQLVIAVGTPAMQSIAQKNPAVSVLNVLVSRSAFIRTIKLGGRIADARVFSAVFVDQPWARQLALIRTVLGGHPRVGLLIGTDSQEFTAPLLGAAKDAALPVNVEAVNSDSDLLPALRHLLANSEALLALPDPSIYNRNNIQSILLSSYRQKVPLFGFSLSYVKAGALSAVYSVPAQLSQQVAELVLNLPVNGYLPVPQFPRYYSVSVNTQVARSLGIDMDDEPALLNKLQQAERVP